jgi:hypothetical protein
MGTATQISSIISPKAYLVVSCRESHGDLLVIAFNVSPEGKSLLRVGDSGKQAGKVSEVASMIRPYGVLTAVRTSQGTLLLIAWKIGLHGKITRAGDSTSEQAGEANLITLSATRQTDTPVLTSVRSASGTVKLITWDDESDRGEL